MKPRRASPATERALHAQKDAKSAGTLLALQDMPPPAGSGAGFFELPAWGVGAVGATVVLSGILYFLWRVRSSRRSPRAPTSARPVTSKIR
jgi:hypothetical protein